MNFLNTTHTPGEEEVSTGQHSWVGCGSEQVVVFEPGHLGGWFAVRRPAGDCRIFSSPHRQVGGLLDEAPVHLWRHATSLKCTCGAPVYVLLSFSAELKVLSYFDSKGLQIFFMHLNYCLGFSLCVSISLCRTVSLRMKLFMLYEVPVYLSCLEEGYNGVLLWNEMFCRLRDTWLSIGKGVRK